MILSSIRGDFIGGTIDLFSLYWPLLLQGLYITLLLSFLGTFLGLIAASFLVALKTQENTYNQTLPMRFFSLLSKQLASVYVTIFRGTPMIVQAMVLYYGLARLGVRLPILVAGLLVVSLNTAAYITEILRSGLEALNKGQSEAALSLGLSPRQTYWFIRFPQAFKNMIPAIGNELIVNIKDTAVLSVIGVGELFYTARGVAGSHWRYTETFFLVAMIYLLVVMIAVYGLKMLSTYLGKSPKDILRSESEAPL